MIQEKQQTLARITEMTIDERRGQGCYAKYCREQAIYEKRSYGRRIDARCEEHAIKLGWNINGGRRW